MTAVLKEVLPSQAPPSITTEIVKVTPALAEKWLAKNTRNRHMSARVVGRYTEAMRRGEWLLNGESIKFSATGELLDGQHRLAAVFESQKTVLMLVVRGLPSSAQNVMDTGRARTTGDQLGISGFPDSTALAAAAKLCIQYESGGLASKVPPSTPRILAFVERNEMIAFATARARSISKGCDLRPAMAAMCFYELMKVDDEKAQEFFDRLTDGAGLAAGHPILALRARLRTLRDERSTLPAEALTSLVFRTWNAYRAGRSLTNLQIYRNGEIIACPEPK